MLMDKLRISLGLYLLVALCSGRASADHGLPDELNPDLMCPLPHNDLQNHSRALQVQAELTQIAQHLNHIHAEASRIGGYSPWAQQQIANYQPRKQALEYELWQRNQRAAQLLQDRPACLARLREARVRRVSTTPVSGLRLIPETQRIPEESAAIAAADAAEAAERATQQEEIRKPRLMELPSKEELTMNSASPQAIREILSAHLCNWKRQLSQSEAQNKSIYYRGQVDSEVDDWKEFIAANARLFREHKITPLACNTQRMKVLLSCLSSVTDMDGAVFTADVALCTKTEDPLIELDRLLNNNHRLDICLDGGVRRACRDPSAKNTPEVATSSGMSPERARKLGLSETKVALSARRCLYSRMLRYLAKKPDPTAETPATWSALLAAVNHQLADAKIKPMACEDREIGIAVKCLGSVLGGLMKVPLWCTNDRFMREVVQVDDKIELGTELPEEKGTVGELEQKAQEGLRKLGVETEVKCTIDDKRRTMVIDIVGGKTGCVGNCIFSYLNNALGDELRKAQYEQLIVRQKNVPNGRSWTQIMFR